MRSKDTWPDSFSPRIEGIRIKAGSVSEIMFYSWGGNGDSDGADYIDGPP